MGHCINKQRSDFRLNLKVIRYKEQFLLIEKIIHTQLLSDFSRLKKSLPLYIRYNKTQQFTKNGKRNTEI